MGRSKIIWPTRTENQREISGFRRTQNDDNFEKANKVPGDVENNIPILDGDGDLKDSGYSFDDVVLRDSNIVYAASNYAVQVNDEVIYILCSVSDITITLPADAGSRTYKIVKADETNFKGVIAGQAGETINKNTTLELYMYGESYEPTKVNKSIAGSDWLI